MLESSSPGRRMSLGTVILIYQWFRPTGDWENRPSGGRKRKQAPAIHTLRELRSLRRRGSRDGRRGGNGVGGGSGRQIGDGVGGREFVGEDGDGDAAVFGAAFGGGIVRDRTELAVADGPHAARVHAGLFTEEMNGGQRAGGGELPIAGKPAAQGGANGNIIGVADHVNFEFGMFC